MSRGQGRTRDEMTFAEREAAFSEEAILECFREPDEGQYQRAVAMIEAAETRGLRAPEWAYEALDRHREAGGA